LAGMHLPQTEQTGFSPEDEECAKAIIKARTRGVTVAISPFRIFLPMHIMNVPS